MSNPNSINLGSIIPSALVRRIIYGSYIVAVLVTGAIQVAYAAIQFDQPAWLIALLAVLAYLGVPIGTLAIANTPSSPAQPRAPPEARTASWPNGIDPASGLLGYDKSE